MNICFKIKNDKGVKVNIFNSPDNRSDKKHVKKLNIFNSTTFDKRRDYVKIKETEDFKYPIQATGSQIVYSSKKCKNQNDKKILMSRSGYLNPFYDDGLLGIGGDCFALLVENEEEAFKKIHLLNSKLYMFYIRINKWSGFHHKKVLQDLIDIEIKDDNDIYEYFRLSEQEIKLIEENV